MLVHLASHAIPVVQPADLIGHEATRMNENHFQLRVTIQEAGEDQAAGRGRGSQRVADEVFHVEVGKWRWLAGIARMDRHGHSQFFRSTKEWRKPLIV